MQRSRPTPLFYRHGAPNLYPNTRISRRDPLNEDRQFFLESTEMLQELREIIARREAGSDHVFEIAEMGLTRSGNDAVQVYRWVPGEDLAKSEGALAADAIIDVGIKLGRAIALLHRHNIIHRDVCPRNIVLDHETDPQSLRPVLIDFGFARLSTAAMSTKLVGEHLAPEVLGQHPQWSKGADVYGLGSTLRWLLHSASSETLEPVLSRATLASTTDRISIEEFLDELTKVSEAEHVDARRGQGWLNIVNAAGLDESKPWFRDQLRKSQGELVGLAMGFQPTLFGRFSGLSNFLNQVLESCPPGGASLKQLRGLSSNKGPNPTKTLWALRNHHVHAVDASFDETKTTIARFRRMSSRRQRQHFLEGVDMIGRKCSLRSLRAVTECVLGPFG